MRTLRTIITWLVVLGLAFVVYKYVFPLFKPEKKETDIQTTEVKRGDLRQVVPADGTIVPRVLVEVKSKASGVVEAIKVEPGDEVKQGDIICELDNKVILADKRQAEANLASAKASLQLTKRNLSPQQKASAESAVRQAQISLDDAQANYDRIKELYDKGYATEAELTTARKALSQAQESLEQAKKQLALDLQGAQPEQIQVAQASVLRSQAELDNVNEELAYTTIRSPLSGTVLTRPVEIGTAVASGTSGMSGGTVVATIGDLSTLYVKAYIEETDLGKVKVGTPCRISTDAFSGWIWNGRVKKVYPQGEASNSQGGSSSRFQVDIEINLNSAKLDRSEEGQTRSAGGGGRSMVMMGPGVVVMRNGGGRRSAAQRAEAAQASSGKPSEIPSLKPQLTASVDIVLEDHPDVLMIPSQYIKYDEGKPYVEVVKDPKDPKSRERRDVELGFSDGLRFEIKSGLKEGETVILERPIKEENMRRF